MILVGELKPGRNITQDEVASELGVSTTPAREALLRLAAEGFVQASPNRAFIVSRSSPADLEDVWWLHETLSAELARRACERIDSETLARVCQYAADYGHAFRSHDSAALQAANWQFHRTINLTADAPRLQRTLTTTMRFFPRSFYELLPPWADRLLEHHQRIVDALRARDEDAAAAAMTALVRAAKQAVTDSRSEDEHPAEALEDV